VDPVSQLEAEWRSLAPGAIARAFPGWQEARPELRRFASPAQLLAFLQREPAEVTDAPLYAMLALAGRDGLAGRLCLQAILPALKTQAARIVHRRESREELWELLLAFAWERICRYPGARVHRVAANVVLDVLHETTRELRRGGPALPAPHAARLGSPGAEPSEPERLGAAAVEGLLETAVRAGAIAGAEAELILLTRVDGLALALVAERLGVSYDALLKRRQRAEARLRARVERPAPVRKTPLPILTSGGEPRAPELPASAPHLAPAPGAA